VFLDQNQNDLQFSLFYFDGKGLTARDGKYHLLIEGAKFADQNGFAAVWTPERHFHAFGGIYPNPSVTSAALAMVTRHIRLRAGSVVAPLHQSARIAEEWALVDNLSSGRVDISFASGWHANDFVLFPSRYAERKRAMVESIQQVRRLWRGEALMMTNGVGNTTEVRICPRPIQAEIPIWVTCSGNPETFELAGSLGAGVLTHLLGQSLEELDRKIALYRRARRQSGHAGSGHVTLMLHTFLGETVQGVRNKIRQPFCEYLASSLDLIQKQLNHSAPDGNSIPWRKSSTGRAVGERAPRQSLAPENAAQDTETLVADAFNRYFDSAALFGTPESCLPMLENLRRVGVAEIACLVDFGVDVDSALRGLEYLNVMKTAYAQQEQRAAMAQVAGFNDVL
jgi:natural product biosynthesis luciferase-like monooxygenase protein